jgi:hypothetical protein
MTGSNGKLVDIDQVPNLMGIFRTLAEVQMTVISPGIVDSPAIAPHAWSTSFAQAGSEAIHQQAMDGQFRWMTEADQHMLQLGLEPVPWEHVADAVGQKGEAQFLAIEQLASEDQVVPDSGQLEPSSLVWATIVIRSETAISAYRIVSTVLHADNATAEMLSSVVKALPQGASLDLTVETEAMHQALKSCADIMSHGWDPDQYCQHEGWKEVVTVWKDQNLTTTVRVFQEDGEDSENVPFRAQALREAIQAVKDGLHDRDSPRECS